MSLESKLKVLIGGDALGAEKAFKSVQASAKKTAKAFDETKKSGGGLFSSLSGGAALGVAAGLAGAAGAAIELGKAAVTAAEDEQTAHAKLVTALKDSGQAWDANAAAIDAADKAGEHFGYTTAETETVLAQLETSTGNTEKSLKLLGVAQDLAAAKNIPLSDAAMAVTKASEGQTRAMKQLGLDFPLVQGGATNTKKAYEALLKAQKDLQDVQTQVTQNGNLKEQAQLVALANAKQNLAFLEQRLHDQKTITVADQQALVKAQEAVTNASAGSTASQQADAAKLEAAHQKVAKAQAHLNDVSNAGNKNIEVLSKTIGGQAAAAADTFKGSTKELAAKWDDFEAKVGKKIIPVIEDLMKTLSDPQTFQDISIGWHDVEQDILDAINVVDTALNPLIETYNAIQRVGNAITGKDASSGTIAHLPTNLSAGPLPGEGGDNPTGKINRAGGIGVYYGPLAPGEHRQFGPVAPGEVGGTTVVQHINMHAQPTPTWVAAQSARHRQRNGTRSNGVYTAVAP